MLSEYKILLTIVVGIVLVVLFAWIRLANRIMSQNEYHTITIKKSLSEVEKENADLKEEMKDLKVKLDLVSSMYKKSEARRSREARIQAQHKDDQDK